MDPGHGRRIRRQYDHMLPRRALAAALSRALTSGCPTAELHHPAGHDPQVRQTAKTEQSQPIDLQTATIVSVAGIALNIRIAYRVDVEGAGKARAIAASSGSRPVSLHSLVA